MFKCVLFRALQTTASVFSPSVAPTPERSQELVEKYNLKAKPLWEGENLDLTKRQVECKKLYAGVVSGSYTPPGSRDLGVVPPLAAVRLDSVFLHHYGTFERCLLFGRTSNDALEVQEEYALAVVEILRAFNPQHEARAHLHLRKVYGKGAPLPLLSPASADAMWAVCDSHYYREQIAMVNPGVLFMVTNTADPSVSSTPGSNPFRRSHPSKATVSNTPFTGSYGQSKAETRC